LRAIHPLGKSPVITDNGNTVAESGAIVEYIVGAYGNGRLIPPPNAPERLRGFPRPATSSARRLALRPSVPSRP